MSSSSSIEWTDATWNPVTGCTKISPGCKHCYAQTFAERFRGVPGHPFEQGFDLRLWPERLTLPLAWKKPRRIFVNSMSDLFHKDVPEQFVKRCFDVMLRASHHTFQILTKRPERVVEMASRLPWPHNIWIGTSIENADYAWRSKVIAQVDAAIRFLSVEPLLGPIPRLSLTRIDWVIVGGESGPGARPMKQEWVVQIRDRCAVRGVPFFFKQWGGVNKSATGRSLDGRTWDAMPILQGRVDAAEERSMARAV